MNIKKKFNWNSVFAILGIFLIIGLLTGDAQVLFWMLKENIIFALIAIVFIGGIVLATLASSEK